MRLGCKTQLRVEIQFVLGNSAYFIRLAETRLQKQCIGENDAV